MEIKHYTTKVVLKYAEIKKTSRNWQMCNL